MAAINAMSPQQIYNPFMVQHLRPTAKELSILFLKLKNLPGTPAILLQQLQACVDHLLHYVPQVPPIGVIHFGQLLAMVLQNALQNLRLAQEHGIIERSFVYRWAQFKVVDQAPQLLLLFLWTVKYVGQKLLNGTIDCVVGGARGGRERFEEVKEGVGGDGALPGVEVEESVDVASDLFQSLICVDVAHGGIILDQGHERLWAELIVAEILVHFVQALADLLFQECLHPHQPFLHPHPHNHVSYSLH